MSLIKVPSSGAILNTFYIKSLMRAAPHLILLPTWVYFMSWGLLNSLCQSGISKYFLHCTILNYVVVHNSPKVGAIMNTNAIVIFFQDSFLIKVILNT